MALTMTPEEVAAMIPENKRWEYEFAALDEDGKTAAVVVDEWGCVLIMTAHEYEGFGLGTEMVKTARKVFPDKTSGGFTVGGANNLRRVHAAYVREYMASGLYSALVRQGDITTDRVKEIVKSVEGVKRPPKSSKNYNTNDPKDWKLFANDDGTVIVYDKKITEIVHDDDYYRWAERFIIGVVMPGSYTNEHEPFVSRFYGKNDKIKGFILELAVSIHTMQGGSLRLDKDEIRLLKARGTELVKDKKEKIGDAYKVKNVKLDWRELSVPERVWRKQVDKYDELYHTVMELADMVGNPANQSEKS